MCSTNVCRTNDVFDKCVSHEIGCPKIEASFMLCIAIVPWPILFQNVSIISKLTILNKFSKTLKNGKCNGQWSREAIFAEYKFPFISMIGSTLNRDARPTIKVRCHALYPHFNRIGYSEGFKGST